MPYNTATKALVLSGIKKYPLTAEDAENMIKDLGWRRIKAFDLKNEKHIYILSKLNLLDYAERYKGFSYLSKKSDLRVVFYNAVLSNSERLAVLAHELGHIMLKHFSKNRILCYHNKLYEEKQETEANTFARYLLAHPLLLREMSLYKAEDISKATSIDIESAKIQAYEAMSISESDYITDDERQLIQAFKPYINKNRKGGTQLGNCHV